MNRLVLVGTAGSGKSTVGRQLEALELDEDGLELDGTRSPHEICSSVVDHVRARETCSRTSS